MKNIDCIDGTVATRMRAKLTHHAIMRGVYHIGPRVGHPMIRLVVSTPIEAATELAIRGEIELIAGTSIQN